MGLFGKTPIEASALHFSYKDYEGVKYTYQLTNNNKTILNINQISGCLGYATNGPTLDKYRIRSNTDYEYEYTILPYDKTSDDINQLSKVWRDADSFDSKAYDAQRAQQVEELINKIGEIVSYSQKRDIQKVQIAFDELTDKHSEPSMSDPASALNFDERTGMYYVDLGNYFARHDLQEPDVQYITWDGNLDAAYKEIEILLQQLYTLSEMGQAFMEGGGGGEASSGTALKLRMVSPRIKAARLVGINEATIKRIIVLLAQVNGITLNYDGLTIHWNDGLPDDEVEKVNTLVTATGGKPIMSQYSAMKRMGLSDEQVEVELEQNV